jgi:hypothetical protein
MRISLREGDSTGVASSSTDSGKLSRVIHRKLFNVEN